MSKALAIITARSGSKRIPKKNIMDFCGKPIISYSIETAIQSKLFDEVMVSTDSEEIANIARNYGASVPFLRSSETSGDYATTDDVIKEVLLEYEKKGKSFDYFCCIYPTAPFITVRKLENAMALLDKADSVMPVVRFSFPPQRCFIINSDGMLQMKYPEHAKTRSQDLEPYYHDCGQFYCCKTSEFLKYGTTDLPNMIPLEFPETEVQDIDNYEDFAIAELKYQQMIERRKRNE